MIYDTNLDVSVVGLLYNQLIYLLSAPTYFTPIQTDKNATFCTLYRIKTSLTIGTSYILHITPIYVSHCLVVPSSPPLLLLHRKRKQSGTII